MFGKRGSQDTPNHDIYKPPTPCIEKVLEMHGSSQRAAGKFLKCWLSGWSIVNAIGVP
jgi:hypothetical protein